MGDREGDLTFENKRMNGARFHIVDLTGARLASATFANCTVRRCRLDGIVNAERLAGVRMPLSDALASVETLAAAARIELLPDDER